MVVCKQVHWVQIWPQICLARFCSKKILTHNALFLIFIASFLIALANKTDGTTKSDRASSSEDCSKS